MAAGMTLHQLYSQQQAAYDDHAGHTNAAASSSSGSTSAAAASNGNGNGGGAPPSRPKPADKSYDAMSHPHAAYQVAPSHYQPHYTSYSSGNSQFQSKGAAAADEYAADPLPFEYHGARKYADAYAAHHHHHHHAAAAAAAYAMPKTSASSYYASQHPSDRSHYHPASEMTAHFPHASHHGGGGGGMFAPQLPLTHSFPSLLDPKKEGPPQSQVATSSSGASTGAGDQTYAAASVSASSSSSVAVGPQGGAAQEAMIKVKTPLKSKYWRNGRRNLQCFPSCKVFGDYSAIKIEDLKQHDFMWGKCRGSIVTEVTLNSNVSFDDLVILGRVHSLENIPVAFEEAVIRECMLGRMVEPDVMDSMKDQWISGERLPDFVQQDGHTACFEFKPKVWKYTEDMAQGKCKRRNVKYYVQFEAFVLVMAGERRYYACIGSGMSTAFEVGSSRVLARQKRKAANTSDDLKNGGSPATDIASVMQPMHHHPLMTPHGMMGQPSHLGMAPAGMFQSSYHHHGGHENMPPNRGLPAFPQMHQAMPQDGPHQAPPVTVAVSAPVVGGKRKASSDRPAFPAERASKLLKPAVAQSVPL